MDLFNREGVLPAVMGALRGYVDSSSTELKVRALAVLAEVITARQDDDGQVELDLNAKCLYGLDRQPMDRLVALCKQPISELAAAAYGVLVKLAVQQWGLFLFNVLVYICLARYGCLSNFEHHAQA